MLKIGSLKLENWLVMAPLAGYTNLAFRSIAKRFGAGLVTTEMVSAMGLVLGQRKTMDYMKSHSEEKPLAIQIFGSKPEVMARAAETVAKAGADLVDINMGCPVKKVTKTGAGAFLLKDLKNAQKIVLAVRLASPIPMTVKIRLGWSPREPVACDMAKLIEDCGADAITLHPRFASEGFSTPAQWAWISRVKETVKIPVIGNGDVFDAADALKMKEETGCDGVMIGRGAIGNPWIFRDALRKEKDLPLSLPDLTERRSVIIEHYQLLCGILGERKAALSMRGILLWYTRGLPHSGGFRARIGTMRDKESLFSVMDHYFSELGEQQK